MKFAIRNVGRQNKPEITRTFTSLEEARVALREALGWDEVQLGPGYTTASATGQIWCAYRTRAEAEADLDGLAAPRVVRLDADPAPADDDPLDTAEKRD